MENSTSSLSLTSFEGLNNTRRKTQRSDVEKSYLQHMGIASPARPCRLEESRAETREDDSSHEEEGIN